MFTCSLYLSALILSDLCLIAYKGSIREDSAVVMLCGWVRTWTRKETAVLWRGLLGRAGDSDDLCLSSPDVLPSYCSGSGLINFWLETLPRKGGAGQCRRPLVWSGLCPFIPSSVSSPTPLPGHWYIASGCQNHRRQKTEKLGLEVPLLDEMWSRISWFLGRLMGSILKRSSVGSRFGNAGLAEVRTLSWLQDFSELVPILSFWASS